MNIKNDVSELLKADVIAQETADKILDYYRNKSNSTSNRLFIVFGVLGAILVGLGINLIIAHNWDELSRSTKTIIAFLPLAIGHILAFYTLLKRNESLAWKESVTTFLFFAVGISLALISQIYHLPGEIDTYILTWVLLCLPVIFILNSSITSMLYIIGISYHVIIVSAFNHSSTDKYLYWLLLLAILPYYYHLIKNKPNSNFVIFHNWLLPLSMFIAIAVLSDSNLELIFISFFSVLAFYIFFGNLFAFNSQKIKNNGFNILGSLGTITFLIVLSFDWYWKNLREREFLFSELIYAPEFYASIITTLFASLLFYLQQKNKSLFDIKLLNVVFILFIAIFFIGLYSPIAVVLVNILVLTIGVSEIKEGAKQVHLVKLNFGLLVITSLIISRFFDNDLSFVVRGLLFVSVGIGFFVSNYLLLKKRKSNDK